MRIDVTEILNGRVSRLPIRYDFSPADAYTGEDAPLLPEDITIPEGGIHVDGTLRSANGLLTLTADVTVGYIVPCARCLTPIDRTVSFSLTRIVRTTGSTAKKRDSHVTDDEWDGVLDDVLVLEDNFLCPDRDILEELAIELPYYELCTPDCPGLCPICGKPKRDGDCGCEAKAAEEAKKEIDPRLAKLKKLLENPE